MAEQHFWNPWMPWDGSKFTTNKPVFRIRTSLNADPDPDQGFYLHADPDPDSGFWTLKTEMI